MPIIFQIPPTVPRIAQQDPKGKKKDPKGNTNTSDPAKTQPAPGGNSEPPKDDPVGGPSAIDPPQAENEWQAQQTTVPMHGFITDSEKEVSDVNLISGLARGKDTLN